MSCEWREKIGPYVDEELAPAAQQDLSAHLAGCSECTAAVAEHLALKKAVRVAGSRFSAPPELHAAIYRQLHPAQSSGVWWKWATAAVSLAAVLALAVVMLRPVADNRMVAGLVDQHITTLASANPVDIVNNNRHVVKPWFQGKLPFTFNPPELAGSSYELIGAKQVFVQQRPGALLLYRAGAHKISVFIFQASDRGTSSPSWERTRSFNACSWREAGLEFHMITDANQQEAYRLAEMFEEANRS
jgi:anti-sigma factor RsiW